jgi:hypothetical protein
MSVTSLVEAAEALARELARITEERDRARAAELRLAGLCAEREELLRRSYRALSYYGASRTRDAIAMHLRATSGSPRRSR